MHRDWLNRLLAAITLIVLLAVVAALGWSARQTRRRIDESVRDAVALVHRSNALGDPQERRVDFAALERAVRQAESFSTVRRIYVAKRLAGREEPLLVHPFWYAAAYPDWARRLEGMRRESVLQDLEELGVVYLDLDTRALAWMRAGMAVVVILIVLVVAALVARIFSQERVLTETNRVLEENQRELIRLERLALAGLLTSNIFHDIRKPVTNIKHELADLSEALGGFAGATRSLRNMRDQVRLFFDILNDLNIERFVRADETDEEYVDVNRVLEQSLRLVHYERAGTQLTVTLSTDLPLTLAHPYRLVQVFSNIILNAYQALEGRGELRIATRPLAAPPGARAVVGGAPPEGMGPAGVAVEFIDNGPGISPEDLERICTPFYTTKADREGSGLGLYISRSIVESLGGVLVVESDLGEGTTMRVELPADE